MLRNDFNIIALHNMGYTTEIDTDNYNYSVKLKNHTIEHYGNDYNYTIISKNNKETHLLRNPITFAQFICQKNLHSEESNDIFLSKFATQQIMLMDLDKKHMRSPYNKILVKQCLEHIQQYIHIVLRDSADSKHSNGITITIVPGLKKQRKIITSTSQINYWAHYRRVFFQELYDEEYAAINNIDDVYSWARQHKQYPAKIIIKHKEGHKSTTIF